MTTFEDLKRAESLADIEKRIGADLAPCTVLGFDVYKYGSMKPLAQRLVPMILHPLRMAAVKGAFEHNAFIFQHYSSKDEIHQRFIDTGDGGLYILANPIEALVILIYHSIEFQLYNSRSMLENARDITDELQLRYAITIGDCYKYRNNYYGSGIINASRTMAKDQLNRILIDKAVHDWFSINFMGLSNLPNVGHKALASSKPFAGYDATKKNKDLFTDHPEAGRILEVVEMKLQETSLKTTLLELYAIALSFEVLEAVGGPLVRIAMGNLNTSGLT